jgi:hypothetical protein
MMTVNVGVAEVSLGTIEGAAKGYAAERGDLAEMVRELTEEIEGLKRAALPRIKRAVGRTAERHSDLKGLLERAPWLFVKPRTVIFHGIKVGFEKGKGKIEFEDEQRVIKLIRSKLPEQAEGLIGTDEYVRKSGLKGLSVAELKAIGCTVEESGDQVVIKAADGDVDKVVNALLKEATEENCLEKEP